MRYARSLRVASTSRHCSGAMAGAARARTAPIEADARHLASISFAYSVPTIVLIAHRRAVNEREAQVDSLSQALTQEVERWCMRLVSAPSLTLRGFARMAATTILGKLGEFRRFARRRELMGYAGLVQSRHSTCPSAGPVRSPDAATVRLNACRRRRYVAAVGRVWVPAVPSVIRVRLVERLANAIAVSASAQRTPPWRRESPLT